MKLEPKKSSPATPALLAARLCLAAALVGPVASADGVAKDWGPKHGVTFGGSFAGVVGAPGPGICGGAELTYFRRARAPVYGWVSAGYRVRSAQAVSHLPYLETGATLFFLDLGLGFAPALSPGHRTSFLVNGFAALNVPIYFPTSERVLFLEPYYRAGAAVDFEDGLFHELGVMAKFFWAFRAD